MSQPKHPEHQDKIDQEIPEQHQGHDNDIFNHSIYHSEADTKQAFRQTRAHMLDVNNWFRLVSQTFPVRTLGGLNPMVPVFTLVGKDEKQATAAVEDVIRLSAGGQDMYVRIEEIVDCEDEFAIRVRPCNPLGNPDQSQHMYQPVATNTFSLRRQNLQIINGFHGRNEVPNPNLFSILSDAGMIMGGRYFNWSLLGEAWRPDPEKIHQLRQQDHLAQDNLDS